MHFLHLQFFMNFYTIQNEILPKKISSIQQFSIFYVLLCIYPCTLLYRARSYFFFFFSFFKFNCFCQRIHSLIVKWKLWLNGIFLLLLLFLLLFCFVHSIRYRLNNTSMWKIERIQTHLNTHTFTFAIHLYLHTCIEITVHITKNPRECVCDRVIGSAIKAAQ